MNFNFAQLLLFVELGILCDHNLSWVIILIVMKKVLAVTLS
jgi:hypothetical protein